MGGDPCAGSSCYWLMFSPDGDHQFSKVMMLIVQWKKREEYFKFKHIEREFIQI